MSDSDITFVTGATGFIGHYVLAALLRRGASCTAIVRSGASGRVRLHRLLREIDEQRCDTSTIDRPHARTLHEAELVTVEGSLPDDLPDLRDRRVGRIVHLAADTRFAKRDGEPFRTNVEGTRRLLGWADAHDVCDLTLVSTAFVCGRRRGTVLEEEPCTVIGAAAAPAKRHCDIGVHNAYEASKQQAEELCRAWARQPGRRLTIARPGVVAGDSATGRATAFRGFYVVARAVELLSRALDDAPRSARHAVTLRMPGRSDNPNYLVPVDFAAEAVAHLAMDHQQPGGVYHLTPPRPATQGDIQRWLEFYFDLGGGRFVGRRTPHPSQYTPHEAMFHDGARSVVGYFKDALRFDTRRANAVLGAAGIACPIIDGDYVHRLLRFAQRVHWGRRVHPAAAATASDPESARGAVAARRAADELFAAYFERFLPEHLPRSTIARMTPVRATMRFVIDGTPDGEWVCRFDAGRLTCLSRGPNGLSEEFGYRATPQAFWEAVGGQVEGEALFMSQQADVFGDVEKALKMSAILREFTREFPCDPPRLMKYMSHLPPA